jgi:WD40 repeat protein
MNETKDLLDRVGDRFGFPEAAFERLERRRDRKRRNRRIAAGVAGIAIFAALVLGLARATLTDSSHTPVSPDPSPSPSIQTEQLPPLLGQSEGVVRGEDETLEAFDQDTGERRTLVRCQDPCGAIYRYAVSTDGTWLAYEVWTCLGAGPCESEAGIWVTNALGERSQLTRSCPKPDSCDGVTWAWSPIGATLAVAQTGDAPGVFTVDPQSGEHHRISNTADVTAFAWSPDGSRVAYAGSELHVTDLASGRTISSGNIGSVTTIAWSPDGTSLAVDSVSADRDRIIVVAADGSGQQTLVDQGAPQGPSAPAWSPDGSRIAYVSTPQKEGATNAHFSFEVWVVGADGSNPTRIFAGKCCIGDWDGPIWSPDGERVAFFDDVDVSYGTWLAMNADGTGEPDQITEVEAKSWGREGIPSG